MKYINYVLLAIAVILITGLLFNFVNPWIAIGFISASSYTAIYKLVNKFKEEK